MPIVPERVNISRQEFCTLANVLERIPQSLLLGGENEQGESQMIPMTVTGDDEEAQEEAMLNPLVKLPQYCMRLDLIRLVEEILMDEVRGSAPNIL